MLYHVEGTVTDIDVNLVVIDCHGIGFGLNASQNTIASVTKGSTAKLYICESVGRNSALFVCDIRRDSQNHSDDQLDKQCAFRMVFYHGDRLKRL